MLVFEEFKKKALESFPEASEENLIKFYTVYTYLWKERNTDNGNSELQP